MSLFGNSSSGSPLHSHGMKALRSALDQASSPYEKASIARSLMESPAGSGTHLLPEEASLAHNALKSAAHELGGSPTGGLMSDALRRVCNGSSLPEDISLASQALHHITHPLPTIDVTENLGRKHSFDVPRVSSVGSELRSTSDDVTTMKTRKKAQTGISHEDSGSVSVHTGSPVRISISQSPRIRTS